MKILSLLNSRDIKRIIKVKSMNQNAKILIAGYTGLVGSSIYRYLKQSGYINIITLNRSNLDLTNQKRTHDFFKKEKPEYVFLTAAKVGGILANYSFPADFIYDNLIIECNIIKASHENKVKKLLFLGSSCIYPKFAPEPIKEEYLLSGYLEPTNDAYAVGKIAGIKMCQSFNKQYGANYICAIPTNLYGYNDNFNLHTSHVLPALMRKLHEAKIYEKEFVEIWGTGTPRREFLFIDDLADACIFLMNNYNESEIINIGTGKDISILELALLLKDMIGFNGDIIFNNTKPDGTPRKLLDVSKLKNLGWECKTTLKEGIKLTYKWFIDNFKLK